ncbi:hypothetical protein Droror1_Dr00024925 [Drosera rotundifolia]
MGRLKRDIMAEVFQVARVSESGMVDGVEMEEIAKKSPAKSYCDVVRRSINSDHNPLKGNRIMGNGIQLVLTPSEEDELDRVHKIPKANQKEKWNLITTRKKTDMQSAGSRFFILEDEDVDAEAVADKMGGLVDVDYSCVKGKDEAGYSKKAHNAASVCGVDDEAELIGDGGGGGRRGGGGIGWAKTTAMVATRVVVVCREGHGEDWWRKGGMEVIV